MWRFEYELEVLFRDCDPLGHVNNAVYLTYLEAARFAWWRNTFGAQGLKEHGFIVARVEIDYRKAALPGDRLLVRLRVEDIGRSSF
jgi:acyl-CoA thioester hydrolase